RTVPAQTASEVSPAPGQRARRPPPRTTEHSRTSLRPLERPRLAVHLPMLCPLRRSGAPRVGATTRRKGDTSMTKLIAITLALVSLLLVAPVIESGTSGSTQLFVAVGNADGGCGD